MAALSLVLVAIVVAILLVRFLLGFVMGLAVLALLGIGAVTLVRGVSTPAAPVQTAGGVTNCKVYPLICEAYTREYNALHDVKRPIGHY